MKTFKFLGAMALLVISSLGCFAQTGTGMKISTGHRNFQVRITRCEAVGNTCTVEFVMENIGSTDVELGFGWSSFPIYSMRAYDDEGNVYEEANMTLKLRGNIELPANLPVKNHVEIRGVPDSAKSIRRLAISEQSGIWRLRLGDNYLIINDIPIYREGDE